MRKKYETDLTDEQWEVIKPLFVNMRNRKWDKRCSCIWLRRVVNGAIYSMNLLYLVGVVVDFKFSVPSRHYRSIWQAVAGYLRRSLDALNTRNFLANDFDAFITIILNLNIVIVDEKAS